VLGSQLGEEKKETYADFEESWSAELPLSKTPFYDPICGCECGSLCACGVDLIVLVIVDVGGISNTPSLVKA